MSSPSLQSVIPFGPLTAISQLIAALLAIVFCIHFRTRREYRSALSSRSSPKRPPTIPYSIPYLGHYVRFCLVPVQRRLEIMSQWLPRQIYASYVCGRTFNIVTDADSAYRIFDEHDASLSFEFVRWHLLTCVFGANRRHQKPFLAAREDSHACLKTLQPGATLSSVINRIIIDIQENAPGLVSFSESIVDQNVWERPAIPIITPGNRDLRQRPIAVEIGLLTLIRNFVAHVTMRSLVGADFMEVHPSFSQNLGQFENGWGYMALGMPKWLPIRGLAKAYLARRELNYAVNSFHRNLDQSVTDGRTEQGWTELDEVSLLFKSRSAAWRAFDTPSDVKGPADLSLLWAANVKSANLVFWMLLHIWASPGLAQDIRLDIQPYAKATQPSSVFGLPEPPRLIMDVEGLSRFCPVLKACYYECLRVHSAPMSVRKVSRTFSVSDHINRDSKSGLLSFEAGTFLAAPLGVQQRDSNCFESPAVFNPRRYLSMGRDGQQTCDMGALKPWGLGASACPGRHFAEKQVLAVVAAVVSLWDMQPTGLNGWTIPSHDIHSVVATPTTDLRVLVRPRDLPP